MGTLHHTSGKERPSCLASAAIAALAASDLDEKCRRTQDLASRWEARQLSLTTSHAASLLPPDRPGRPKKPDLVPPHLVPRRSIRSRRGMIALLHAIAHIELNAIDLALDIIARFARLSMPRSFYDGWVMVAREEAKHFGLLRARLGDFDATYGDLPAHDGLWEAAQRTGHDLMARLAIVPLVLEARGLDITPSLIRHISETGDLKTAEIFRIIYEDEKGHVAVGAKWFRFLCHKNNIEPAASFQAMVRRHFRGPLKPPFNDLARAKSGITPLFYRTLSPAGN
ncbi:ferritin-like domain-containing protein [Salaquimonas pukyongi]|uniref:ferritin-like domain-containing protein n=1 Tax=Salaquimonas pukyongi TaxID=2712698 RepID=UPI001FCD0994|nr:ferritin-like domain-containing protein [Salaquimonas pukyongi]